MVICNSWYKCNQGDFIAESNTRVKNNKILLKASFLKKNQIWTFVKYM